MSTTATNIDDIRRLREETGAGIMEARKALVDAGGDFAKAKVLLEQRGAAGAAKRAGRVAAQGVIEPYIHTGGQIGVLVELDSETDFVARMPEFRELARELAMQVAATNPKYVSLDEIPADEAERMKAVYREEAVKAGREKFADKIAEGQFEKYAKEHALLEQEYIRDSSKTVKQLVQDLAAKTRENILVRRFVRFQVGA
ncbi:MAG TPA: elongation factor Ts [Chloroflexota bacterium]|nr:elongation factor Ts [Chloroflexota bacterium]